MRQEKYGEYNILADPENPDSPWILGEGNFGVTYRATHRLLQEEVALKVLKDDIFSSEEKERFVREATTLKGLNHKHIAAYDYVGMSDSGHPYCTIEFCEGGDLKSIAAEQNGLSIGHLLIIGEQVCDALSEAHANGYIHRDIKPSNLLLKRESADSVVTKLIDFGLALDQRASLKGVESSGEHFKGTKLFASPEQLRCGAVDGRSDMYSLGITLWYLFNGSRPTIFCADTAAEVVAPHLDAEAFDLSEMPQPLRDVVAKLVEKDPTDRFENSSAARDAFREAQAELNAEGTLAPVTLRELLVGDGVGLEFVETAGEPVDVDSRRTSDEVYDEVAEVLWESVIGPVHRAVVIEGLTEVAVVKAGCFDPVQANGRPTLKQSSFDALKTLYDEHTRLALKPGYPEALIGPSAWHRFRDTGEIFIECDLVNGVSLQDFRREHGRIDFPEAISLVQPLGKAMDFLAKRNLPQPLLYESQIILAVSGPLKKDAFYGADGQWHESQLRILPWRIPGDIDGTSEDTSAESDAFGTIDGGTSDGEDRFDPVGALAAKIYLLVGGRPVAQTAWHSTGGYTNTPGIGPEGNELLKTAIASSAESSAKNCADLLEKLCHTEGFHGGSSAPRKPLPPISRSGSASQSAVSEPGGETKSAPTSRAETVAASTVVALSPAKKRALKKAESEKRKHEARVNGRANKSFFANGMFWAGIAVLCGLIGWYVAKAYIPAITEARELENERLMREKEDALLERARKIEEEAGRIAESDLESEPSPDPVPSKGEPIEDVATSVTDESEPEKSVNTEKTAAGDEAPDDPSEEALATELERLKRKYGLFGEEIDPSIAAEPAAEPKPEPEPIVISETPQGRAEQFGIATPVHETFVGAGNRWEFHFREGQWVTLSQPLRGVPDSSQAGQCAMWTEPDQAKGALSSRFYYVPVGDGNVAIADSPVPVGKSVSGEVAAPAAVVNQGGLEPGEIRLTFVTGSRLHQQYNGGFRGKPQRVATLGEAEVKQIATLEYAGGRAFRDATHLTIRMPDNGAEFRLVNWFVHHPDWAPTQ